MVQNAGSASVGSGGLLFRFTRGVLFNRHFAAPYLPVFIYSILQGSKKSNLFEKTYANVFVYTARR
ncbi:hypothetical protein DUU90_20020 [Salmonella enterica subsp. enterica]|nr:hypothetical protein [Salmonella enterica subsp. enterica serovar Brunei]EAA8260849.1 hypothetical protein [Salmonella enterica subsp. enterica]EAM2899363.1 hypothetical protein [Salmonella enterica]EBV5391454.1 hypothetical protein [Salmonella enterica subsp. enterica serovar Tananarive]EAB6820976.1 hypothetical protein [Salmonella enterica subsp. enterica serovar Brunei]